MSNNSKRQLESSMLSIRTASSNKINNIQKEMTEG